jgi:hypothetical protein
MQVWPIQTACDPEGWLSNFRDADLPLAVHLLNAFMYFRQPLIDQLFVAAFQQLSTAIAASNAGGRDAWRRFVDEVIITRVVGETLSDADSGFQYVRLARQIFGVGEDQLLPPERALSELLSQRRPLVLVDDFCGSGTQFKKMWRREFAANGTPLGRFSGLPAATIASIHYCPLIATSYGVKEITTHCHGVAVSPAHTLSERYGAFALDSLLWPANLRAEGRSFVKRASIQAGIPDNEFQGFHSLGLALAFEHFTTPDASLPMFYWDQNGWIPLVRRL